MILGNYLCYKLNKNGKLAKVINGAIAIGELLTISFWDNLNGEPEKVKKKWRKKFPKINIKTLFYVGRF